MTLGIQNAARFFAACAKKFTTFVGLDALPLFRFLRDRFANTQIPFPVVVQGCRMPYVLFRIWLKGIHEPPLTRFIARTVRPGWTAVDLGAQYGYYTMLLARLVGSTGRVFSFEPFRKSFLQLEAGIGANKFSHVTAVNSGVSDKNGEEKFYVPIGWRGTQTLYPQLNETRKNRQKEVRVRVRRLDDFLREIGGPSVQFIKMDIEGAEAAAFRGMEDAIRRNPDVAITVELLQPKALVTLGVDPEGFLRQLRSYGFNLYYINEDGTTAARSDQFLLAEAERHKHINIVLSRSDP